MDSIHADHRKQKVGYALVIAAEEHFRTLGCTGLLVDCFTPNQNAHAFYHRYGFTDRVVSLRKPLT